MENLCNSHELPNIWKFLFNFPHVASPTLRKYSTFAISDLPCYRNNFLNTKKISILH